MSLYLSLTEMRRVKVFDVGVTHNLVPMAKACGLYEVMWHPHKRAVENITLLQCGILNLTSDPERFKKLEPKNGWGTYENLLADAGSYLAACLQDPNAEVEASK